MNQEYIKIAQETDAWCDQYFSGNDYYTLYWEEKFAELIVKKCAEICNNQSLHYAEHNNEGSASSAAHVCSILIKSYFGVDK